MRRIVALVVAAGLVAIAVVVRGQMNGGGGSGGSSGGQLRLVCSPDLDSVCNSLGRDLDISLEEPGATTDSFVKAGLSRVDAWLTPEPWPDIVEAAVAQALRRGARVETITEDGRFETLGSVGALLRF